MFKCMKEESVAQIPINLLAVSQNMLESYDLTIALRSNGNQALQSWYNVTSRQHESHVARQKLLTHLVFQLVVRQHLNACNISSSACDKVRLIGV